MAEYIEREYLLAEYDRVHVGPPGGARKLIEEAPAADVVPVVHGRWKERFNMVGRLVWDCSECDTTSLEHGLYCPYCGAYMMEQKGG